MVELEDHFLKLEAEGRRALERSGIPADRMVFERAADMRYVGQEHAVAVRVPAKVADETARQEIKRLFDDAHAERYSHSAPGESADVVSLRVSAIGRLGKPEFPRIGAGGPAPEGATRRGTRSVVFEGHGALQAAVFDRARLLSANAIQGPAIIEEAASTTIVAPGDTVTVNAFGHLIMQLGAPH